MKKGLVFFLGMIVGAVLTIAILAGYNQLSGSDKTPDSGITMFDTPGPTMTFRSFEVFQVLPNGTALAKTSDKLTPVFYLGTDPIVLLLPGEGIAYFDDQIIKVPANKCVKQVGTYRYETKDQFIKTVPIVKIQNK